MPTCLSAMAGDFESKDGVTLYHEVLVGRVDKYAGECIMAKCATT